MAPVADAVLLAKGREFVAPAASAPPETVCFGAVGQPAGRRLEALAVGVGEDAPRRASKPASGEQTEPLDPGD